MINVKRELKLASPIVKLMELTEITTGSGPQQVYTAMISAKELLSGREFRTDPNARNASDKNKAYKAMKKTLEEDYENFAIYNNGIDILASTMHVENWGRNNDARVIITYNELESTDTIDDNDIVGGILNGGHTYRAIKDTDNLGDDTMVRLTILVNIDPDIRADVIRARNTSQAVSDSQLAVLKGKYSKFEEEVRRDKALRCRISFKGNEFDTGYDVVDAIQRINLLDVKKYPEFSIDGKSGPLAVSETASPTVLAKRIAGTDKKGDGTGEERIGYLYPLFRELVRLEDFIRTVFDGMISAKIKSYNRSHKHDPIGDAVFANKTMKEAFPGCSKPRKGYVSITGTKFNYKVPNAYIFPLMSSFRFLVESKGTTGRWIGPTATTINTLWKSIDGVSFVHGHIDNIREKYVRKDESTVNATEFGKDSWLWEKADMYILRHKYYNDNK